MNVQKCFKIWYFTRNVLFKIVLQCYIYDFTLIRIKIISNSMTKNEIFFSFLHLCHKSLFRNKIYESQFLFIYFITGFSYKT